MQGLGPQLFPRLEDSTPVVISNSAGLDVPVSTLLGNPRLGAGWVNRTPAPRLQGGTSATKDKPANWCW